MSPADLTVRILEEIRDEVRASREEIRDEVRASREEQRAMREEFQAYTRVSNERFEVIETSLRDLTQQLVMLGRAIKVALSERTESRRRLDDHEERIAALEKPRRTPRASRRSR